MRSALFACVALIACGGSAFADVAGSDLPALSLVAFENVGHECRPLPDTNITCTTCTPALRWYAAPILGATWGTISNPDADTSYSRRLMTGGGAVGLAITRPLGQWRVESEGRYRDGFEVTQAGVSGYFDVTDNWSAMVNLWRDIPLTQKLGVYGGGGLGLGGYRFDYNVVNGADVYAANSQVTNFAWQGGVGMFYELNERVSLDLGWRYYSVDVADTDLQISQGGVPVGSLVAPNQFVANEVLFQVRIYEPFRRWR
jgi:opacity protein-like surface antigen